jgi:hypothetical protein
VYWLPGVAGDLERWLRKRDVSYEHQVVFYRLDLRKMADPRIGIGRTPCNRRIMPVAVAFDIAPSYFILHQVSASFPLVHKISRTLDFTTIQSILLS